MRRLFTYISNQKEGPSHEAISYFRWTKSQEFRKVAVKSVWYQIKMADSARGLNQFIRESHPDYHSRSEKFQYPSQIPYGLSKISFQESDLPTAVSSLSPEYCMKTKPWNCIVVLKERIQTNTFNSFEWDNPQCLDPSLQFHVLGVQGILDVQT